MASRVTVKSERRERAAAMRAAQARVERRRRILLAAVSVLAVVAVIAALVIAKAVGAGNGSSTDTATSGGTTADPAVVAKVTSVPSTVLDQIGAGTTNAFPRSIKAPALTEGGKPRILYVGAEYCPYCAAQRWAVVQAMSRFGTWSSLGATTSAHNDVFPDTPTFSFHGAGYNSDYLDFTGVETRSNQPQNGQYAPLDQLSPADEKIFATYGTEKYTGQADGSIPFIDIGGRYVSAGASFSPQLLAGKSRAEIAAALSDPSSEIAKAVNGSANVMTAAICQATGDQPSTVCSAPGVKAAATALAKAQGQ